MKSTTILRGCVVLMWVIIILLLPLSSFLEAALPEPLTAWLKAEAERPLSYNNIVYAIAAILALISGLVASVGLLFLCRWAAWLYLIAIATLIFLSPFLGPAVYHPLETAFSGIIEMLSGMVIAIAFFTDCLKKNVTETNSTG